MEGLTEVQQDVVQVATDVLAPYSLGDGSNTSALWRDLATAEVLGLALPEELDGSGLGLRELCLVLFEAGRHEVESPLWATVVCAALPLARFGRPGADLLLAAMARGEVQVAAALSEGVLGEWANPSTIAVGGGDRWLLTGSKSFVASADVANRALVSAVTADGQSMLAVVDMADPGLSVESGWATDHRPVSTLTLTEVPAMVSVVSAAGGPDVVAWCVDRAMVGLCAFHAGIVAGAVALSATYLGEREQFGRPLGAFQAVAMRAADAYIDSEAMRNTTMEAVTALEADHPSAQQAVSVAKVWSGSAGARAMGSLQHLHGGLGVDTSYPLHRYFLASKRLQLTLGTAAWHLDLLGQMLVRP
jgi:alkylation response protein AidB-like acyl-CoA dehydrogenase